MVLFYFIYLFTVSVILYSSIWGFVFVGFKGKPPHFCIAYLFVKSLCKNYYCYVQMSKKSSLYELFILYVYYLIAKVVAASVAANSLVKRNDH